MVARFKEKGRERNRATKPRFQCRYVVIDIPVQPLPSTFLMSAMDDAGLDWSLPTQSSTSALHHLDDKDARRLRSYFAHSMFVGP